MIGEQAGGEAIVTIRRDEQGNPLADPVELRVRAGTRVTWRTDSPQPQPFALEFDTRVPEHGPPRRRLDARREGERFQVSIIARPEPASPAASSSAAADQRFDYQVRSGERSVDPAIIIQQ